METLVYYAGWIMRVCFFGGLAMLTLWVAVTCAKRSMWDNAICIFDFMVGALMSIKITLPLVGALIIATQPPPLAALIITPASVVATFIGTFMGMRTVTNKLSRVRVQFPKVFDIIGRIVFTAMTIPLVNFLWVAVLLVAGAACAFIVGMPPWWATYGGL